MKIYSVNDPEFKPYGRVVTGLEAAKAEILQALATTPLPEATDYVAEEPVLQELPAMVDVSEHLFGGMPVQLGWCNGHNTKLNCLEYHRDSEFNLGTEDFILLLAKMDDITDGKLDTAKVKAFRAPAGTLVEVYATTLHYAPCHVDQAKGFRVLVALPQGTNTAKPEIKQTAAMMHSCGPATNGCWHMLRAAKLPRALMSAWKAKTLILQTTCNNGF